ncbi:MAG TPA: alpha-L-rhamnosidase C-terminal domain-containing protein [Actinospica sp.]|nr:alpha-L-rhamnosidase C-terminal domain-containing protein [Actinospica sp.]
MPAHHGNHHGPVRQHPPRHRHRRIALLLACAGVLTIGVSAPSALAGASGARQSATGWQAYDETPTSATVCATAVSSVSGGVTGASGLLCGGSGGATLTKVSGGATPTIVLDYGKDVGGIPFFDVSAESGSPTLQAGYSEGGQYESATGDGSTPWAEGDTSRADSYQVTQSGVITNRYVQGGERFEELTLTTPGSVTLSAAGITYIADLTQASQLAGYFDSSSDELNKIWFDSEYTDQLDSVPNQSLPGSWAVSGAVLDAAGGQPPIGLLNQGASWTDYTDTFDTRIVTNQAGWVVRGQDSQNGYLFILNDSTDTSGTPNQLQELQIINGNYTIIGSVTLPAALTAGSWHTVSTTVSGGTVTVSLDTKQLTSLTLNTFAAGTIGFREFPGEEADFRNLTVTSSSGASLFQNSLGSAAALANFTVPGTNQYASIVDGAKRDRAIWVGDMNVEAPSVFYSTDDAAYIKGSLAALGSYQLTSGFVTGDLPPQDPLHTGAPIAGTTTSYSASYSMYYILGLEDYYLYSGDTAFVASQWPTVENELAWNAGQLDSNGLFVTDSSDNADWDYYDGGKSGEVTEYNLLYYKALLDGAILASAAGNRAQSATYSADAAALKTAINAHLFNTSTGLYDLSNSDSTTVAQDANSLAVLYGVAPAADDSSILAAMKTDLWTTSYGPRPFSGGSYQDVISPFVSGYELDARLATGDTADAEALLESVWGGMIAPGPEDTGTMWENINGSTGGPGFGGGSSLAHGWSTTPVSALSGYVLGVQPATAGYATWTVQPHTGDLSWAQGQVPTPRGAIDVSWTVQNGRLSLTVSAPAGTAGTIAVPTNGAKGLVVKVDGHTVWSGGRYAATAHVAGASSSGGYVYLTGVQAGRYTITTTATGR